eukprot:c11587_g1_i2.p1 GENE.c11587_g1_i2~~c11587_g1_i2.p1  ORF type:complete len:686 (+),score=140.13 c11587_g1_i2:271-2058(+)
MDENGRVKYICVSNYINEPSPDEVCNAAFFVDTINSRIYARVVRDVPIGAEILVSYGAHFPRSYAVNAEECNKSGEYWNDILRQNGYNPKETAPSLQECPKATADGEPVCRLCGKEADEHSGPIEEHSKMKVHKRCALWSCEVYVDENTHEMMNVAKALRRGRQIRCRYCDQKGATVGCIETKCAASYHYHCAVLAGCSMNDRVYAIACPQHVNKLLEVDTTETRRLNPNNLGMGETAWKSYRLARAEACEDTRKAKSEFKNFCMHTMMVRNPKQAPEIEALSYSGPFAGSWWPAQVLGVRDGLALVRYRGYQPEEDEWLKLCDIREVPKLIDLCSDVVVGAVYEVFSSANDWRDAVVLDVNFSKDCSGSTGSCEVCSVQVQYADNAGAWAGVPDTIDSLPKRVCGIQAKHFDKDWQQTGPATPAAASNKTAAKKQTPVDKEGDGEDDGEDGQTPTNQKAGVEDKPASGNSKGSKKQKRKRSSGSAKASRGKSPSQPKAAPVEGGEGEGDTPSFRLYGQMQPHQCSGEDSEIEVVSVKEMAGEPAEADQERNGKGQKRGLDASSPPQHENSSSPGLVANGNGSAQKRAKKNLAAE